MSYSTEYIEEKLQEKGEIILIMDSDAYENHPELHLHDTGFVHDENKILLELADGRTTLDADNIESMAFHQQTLKELGI